MQVGPNFGDDCYFRECDGEAGDTAVAASLWVKGENTERVIVRNVVGSGNGYWGVDLGQSTGWERLTSAHPAVTENNPW